MKHIPVCPLTQNAMKEAEKSELARHEYRALIETLKRHGYNPTPKDKKNEQVSH